ncbi:fructose-6-phosphate aldolase [Asticcacaulis sp. ZE23SCel15]|uniref:fructose-6-phosphate aldolase n=1 Tax=unclassified Asticcacaulis TaxID=2628350 RepID=UPI00226C67AD|nr:MULTISPECIES: fructose-6-phosphate aldolase [unclassified Asticcacaulis]WAC47070.1 fructose-6-phosphate aldolase [Asticcacaulis sp. SL142]WKL59045.1 fructose-6-phosphate aldolase [Asticcacaulis sp. ZE23SCel15]
MQLFADTADTKVLAELMETGLIDGVTTNPTIIAKSGRNMFEVIKEICDLVPGPISAEVVSNDAKNMILEGEKLAKIATNVVVKVPLTVEGLKATKELSAQGLMTNVTLCFSVSQAMLAAKAGATFVSPFIGRLDDHGADGMGLIHDIRQLYDMHEFDTEILAASVRNSKHVADAALAGADCATLPPSVFMELFKHPLTDKGLDAFMKDWASTGQSIL